MRNAYLITAKRPSGRKVFEFEQYHASRKDAIITSGPSLDRQGLILIDAREMTSKEAAKRNIPYCV